jgi:peptidoglycan/LPS O-acetylase OafA/YrhL
MGLAAVSAYLEPRRRQPSWVRWIRREPLLPWLAALACFMLVTTMHTGTDFFLVRGRASAGEDLVSHALYGAIALLIMLPAVFGDGAGGLPRRFMALPPLKWLGLVAYGVYLYHFPILERLWGDGGSRTGGANWLGLLLETSTLAILAGAASYYLIERPILRYKNRRPGVRRARRRAVA